MGQIQKQTPLCVIEPESNTIFIGSPNRLLENSTTQVLTQDTTDTFLDGLSWGQRQITHVAFKIVAVVTRPAVIEMKSGSDAVLFRNGKFACAVRGADARASGGFGFFPIMLHEGENVINLKIFSLRGKPRIQLSVCLDSSKDFPTAWQPRHGLLSKLVYFPGEQADPVTLDWHRNLSGLSVSFFVRNVATDKIVLQRESARRGRVTGKDADLAPGIYEITYQADDESASEIFLVGNPHELFAELQETLSKYNPDTASKADIEAQLRRAEILLAKENYNVLDRQFQEKITFTFNSLATIARELKDIKEGAVNIAKVQPGLRVRSFASGADGSTQFYRLYIPTTYKPDTPVPLLVIQAARIRNRETPFIQGPIMANHREALMWVKYAEQYGFAVLWPGYRSIPEGYSYESVHINEAIQAVEKDYNINKHCISLYATCGAGYGAGRLIAEYSNRFAAIVYDMAIFDLALGTIRSSPSLMEWYTTVNPSRHVIANKNLKIFVLHDNSRQPGHGALANTTAFLERAEKSRNDVVKFLSEYPMPKPARIDKIFSWLSPCKNENPNDKRSYFLAKAGYTGPIMEIFATPILVVEGTQMQGVELDNIKSVVESFNNDYAKYFRDAKCVVKKDTDVTPDDIKNYSLILIGNPKSNSVWDKLQPQIPVKVSSASVFYENDRLTGAQPFQAIVRHPAANDKYILLIGAGDLRAFGQVQTDEIFTAWYDAITTSPYKIISKLDLLQGAPKPTNLKQTKTR